MSDNRAARIHETLHQTNHLIKKEYTRPVILVPRSLRQEDHKFQTNLGYVV
jgi:hypothetical protein